MKKDVDATREFVRQSIERYGDGVYRLAYLHTGNISDAEDIVQEVFIKLYQTDMKRFPDEFRLRAWINRVTLNLCRDLAKSAAKRRNVPLEEDIRTEEREINEVFKVLSQLPEKYIAVIYFHYYEGYNTEETAKMLKLAHGTVKSRLIAARKKLKEILGEDYYG